MNIPLAIIAFFALFILAVGLWASRGIKMSLEQWSIGGRGFGGIVIFVLMAGEIYTTFTFLGASGFAYGHGGAALYIITYTVLAFVSSYWLLPPIWRYAREHRLLTQADFFIQKYDSPMLGLLAALIGLVAVIPYIMLQLKGLGIIVELSSGGAFTSTQAVWAGATVMTVYVIASGVHGSAWIATIKDLVILLMVGFLAIYLPIHYYGGWTGMFREIESARPNFLALHGTEGPVWYCSTILISGLGLYMWPHTFSSIYTSRSERAFRKNSIVMPLYVLVVLLAMVVGFAATLKIPGLTGGQIDLALFKLALQSFDPWFIGVLGGVGLITAVVPGSMMVIAASTLITNNLYGKLVGFSSDRQSTTLVRIAAPLVTLISIYFALDGAQSIVSLLIMGYSLVTQLFPALVASLFPRNPINKFGAAAGICAGVSVVAATVLTKTSMQSLFPSAPAWVQEVNVGSLAMLLNIAFALVVSALTIRARPVERAIAE